MGTMSNLIEFQPFDMIPPTYVNDQTRQVFKQANVYAEPAHLTFFPKPGPYTEAGISEITGTEFLAAYNRMPIANDQIVTVPDRPVDEGTYRAIVARGQPINGQATYVQPNRGVYLQPLQQAVVNTNSVAGSAPTQGIYTGFGDSDQNLSFGNGFAVQYRP